MTATTNWRSELLPKLSGLPIVPCGAGDKFKAPINPATGRPARDWQHNAFTPEEIAAMGPRVICVGTRLGPQAGGIVCFDIDGVSAVNKAIEWGADPDPGGTFSAMQRDCECCWDYVCNTFSGKGVRFQEASEAVAFLAGHYMADKWHEAKAENDAMHEAAAEEGRDAEDGGDAIQLTVAT